MPAKGKLTVRPVTPDLWAALEDLFGRAGASNGCWCMYWRLGPAYRRRPREHNRADLKRLVERGPPPGLLAFEEDVPVGWCQLTTRSSLEWLEQGPLGRLPSASTSRHTKRPGIAHSAGPVWALSCFYVRPGYRRRGVSAALIQAAVRAAKAAGAGAVEAYPVDTHATRSTRNLFTGAALTFAREGFELQLTGRPHRMVMRRTL